MSATDDTDTGLLASLYLGDTHTPAALAAVSAAGAPLLLTSWQLVELVNAFQVRLFRRESNRTDLAKAEAHLQPDISASMVVSVALPAASVLSIARQLTARQTPRVGTRAFAISHVAPALQLKATRFLTLDPRQRALARPASSRTA